MYCIGITGAIASGKSTVLQIVKELGATVISADVIAKQLTEKGPALTAIRDHFGDTILDERGGLNRKKLRTIITEDKTERLWLEALLHPLIRQQIIEDINNAKGAYCMIEIPLLKNKQAYPYLNRILTIESPEEMKIQRTMQRDHVDRNQAIALLKTQPNRAFRQSIADDLIENDGTLTALKEKINQLNQLYLTLLQ